MTRNARTKQFRKEVQYKYFINLIEDYKINPSKEEELKHSFYDNFKYIYDNEELVEEADELGLINWNASVNEYNSLYGLSNHECLQLTWIEKYPTKDWDFNYISKHTNLQLVGIL